MCSQTPGSQQTKVEHDGGGGEALPFPDREPDVREEGEHVHHDQVIERSRDLQELAALPVIEVVAHHSDDADDEE